MAPIVFEDQHAFEVVVAQAIAAERQARLRERLQEAAPPARKR